ncbi:CHC2 zinc finger domain-containing protein [Geoalkalibacter halelectricus]|uniref:CHC2 zinc finger domain-containing protein n=1 Tax=Geoalkalibacter halelectricus TaxID=2847045 RepID=UPI003D1EDB7B
MNALDIARRLEVPERWAAIARLRYLRPLIVRSEKDLAALRLTIEEARQAPEDINRAFLALMALAQQDKLARKLITYHHECRRLEDFLAGRQVAETREFTREQLDAARAVPMETLLAQSPSHPNAQVCCPFHEDRRPSASIKHNVLICFAGCRPKTGGKGWDTIALLMERDGLSFVEAVRTLL